MIRLRTIRWHWHVLTEPEMRERYAYLCWLEECGVKTARWMLVWSVLP